MIYKHDFKVKDRVRYNDRIGFITVCEGDWVEVTFSASGPTLAVSGKHLKKIRLWDIQDHYELCSKFSYTEWDNHPLKNAFNDSHKLYDVLFPDCEDAVPEDPVIIFVDEVEADWYNSVQKEPALTFVDEVSKARPAGSERGTKEKLDKLSDAMDKALRYNTGKVQLSYMLDADVAMCGMCRVLEFGDKKYERNNWKKGMDTDQIIDSLLRHIMKYKSGEVIDEESKLPHIDHITCNAVFLATHGDR